jgi:secreted trypsin-like serine protease
MRKRVLLSTLIILVTVAAGVYALSPQPSKAVTNGQPDGEQHPYVGLVTDRSQICSGSLVNPTTFITAAHCFSESGQQVQVTIHQDGPLAANPDFVQGTWFPHPDYCRECPSGSPGFARNDIAVVVLDAPLNPGRFARVPGVGAIDTLTDGQDLVVVGYGVQDFSVGGGTPQPGAAFTRFFGEVDLVGDNPVSDNFVRARSELTPGGACFGDSGGPVLIEDFIVGVNSFVTSEVCDGDTFAHRIDLESAQAFLSEFLPAQ